MPNKAWIHKWLVFLGLVFCPAMWTGPWPARADCGLSWGTTYYDWTFDCIGCSKEIYSHYPAIKGNVVQADGVDPGTCWGGGETSWSVKVYLENYTYQGETADQAAQPSYFDLSQYRVILLDDSNSVVKTKTIAPGEMNTWFSDPESDYGDSMSWLEPEQVGMG